MKCLKYVGKHNFCTLSRKTTAADTLDCVEDLNLSFYPTYFEEVYKMIAQKVITISKRGRYQ